MSSPATGTVALFGLPISNLALPEAVEQIEHLLHSGGIHQVATADLAFARHALNDPYLQRVLCDSALVLPGALPLLWASSMLGAPLLRCVPAEALLRSVAELAARQRYPVFLLGDSEEINRTLAANLQREYPGLLVAGRCAIASQSLHQMDNESLLSQIDASGAALLLVDFRQPMQHLWLHRHRSLLKVAVSIALGGAFARVARPASTSTALLPRVRAARRSLAQSGRDILTLALHLPLALFAARLQPGSTRPGASSLQVHGEVRVLSTPATFGGAACIALLREARHAVLARQTLVLDLSNTLRVEPEGLGCLLEARQLLLAESLWIWLAGMSNPVRRLLQFHSLSSLFRIAASASEAIYFTIAARSHADVTHTVNPRSRLASNVITTSVARAG